MRDSKYFKSVMLGFLGGCLIFTGLIFSVRGIPTPSSQFVQSLYAFKSRYAQSITEPKIMIVSGSNATYGISTPMLSQATGMPAANFGIAAGLGASYLLHRAQPLAKPGDTIVLPLEYETYELNPYEAEPLIDYVLARDPQYFVKHPLFIPRVSRSRLMMGIQGKFRQPPEVDSSPHLNESGDTIRNREADITEAQRQAIAELTPMKIKGQFNEQALKSIREFAQWCRAHNIQLLATWPNTLWFKEYEQPDYQKFFQAIEDFYKSIGVTVLGNYRDAMYDRSLMYDTLKYHLTDRGVKIRTQHLIELLTPYLGLAEKS